MPPTGALCGDTQRKAGLFRTDGLHATAEKGYDSDVSDDKNEAVNCCLKNRMFYYTLLSDTKILLTKNRGKQVLWNPVRKKSLLHVLRLQRRGRVDMPPAQPHPVGKAELPQS